MAKFHTLSSSAKKFENWLSFDKVTDSVKVGNFFETQYSCSHLSEQITLTNM